MVATYDDANLVVQLARWGTEMGLEDAAHTLFAEGFEPANTSIDEPAVRKMLTYGEVLGTLVKQGVLDRGLVLDLWWASGTWARVKPSAEHERERLGEPRLFENFEALAASSGS